MRTYFSPIRFALAAVAAAAAPLAINATCNPFTGSIDIHRFDDHHHFLDVWVDDCFWFDCHDYYEIDLF